VVSIFHEPKQTPRTSFGVMGYQFLQDVADNIKVRFPDQQLLVNGAVFSQWFTWPSKGKYLKESATDIN